MQSPDYGKFLSPDIGKDFLWHKRRAAFNALASSVGEASKAGRIFGFSSPDYGIWAEKWG
jgi:hypothetical protein